jgi:hypothetical protein
VRGLVVLLCLRVVFLALHTVLYFWCMDGHEEALH